jgi:hypothetical protein
MMLVLVALSVPAGILADGQSPAMTIVVDNRADLRSEVLARAMMHVTRIFGAIGVHTCWACVSPPSPMGFIVHVSILPQLADWPSDSGTHPLGVAASGDRDERIYLFYDQVDQFAGGVPVTVDVVLGHVMAHEIGHLLMPQTSDVESGIMRSHWDRPEMQRANNAQFFFTAKQGALIRERLQHCSSMTIACYCASETPSAHPGQRR